MAFSTSDVEQGPAAMSMLTVIFVAALSGADALKTSTQTMQGRRYRNSAHTHTDTRYVPGEDGTYSQNYQDTWFVHFAQANGWKSGFFLDLGAYRGLQCSNSALLEKKLGFQGICVEPFPVGFESRSCVLVSRPLTDKPDQPTKFYGMGHGQLKHIGFRPGQDSPYDHGVVLNTINIPTLFECMTGQGGKHDCSGIEGHLDIPSFIHFVSLDIEGQESNVLKSFPWDQYQVAAWVVEQRPARQETRDILKAHGYMQAPVQNPGVDEYWVLPDYWKDDLKSKPWRVHPPGSNGC